jgi:hypothetical protein
MSDVIDQLAAAIATHLHRRIPLAAQLWTVSDVASCLSCSPSQVTDRHAVLPGFPKAIRLPSIGRGRGHPRYKASEVIAWAERHQEKA